jgi:hypothetical protein
MIKLFPKISFPFFSLLIILTVGIASSFAGGSQGKELGSLYTQITYSPIESQTYLRADGSRVDSSHYSRTQIENYGELGIWSHTTAFVWNIAWIDHQFERQSSRGFSNSHLAIHHQWGQGPLQWGQGLFIDLASFSDSELALSQKDPIYGYSQFHSWRSWEGNIHILSNGQDEAVRFDFKHTWNPTQALYLSAALRGQFTNANLNRSPDILGYGLQAQYLAPGIEIFYTLNSNVHWVGAVYGGTLMRQIYGFPGLKTGLAMTL